MIRIATRKSELALWQANYLANRLRNLSSKPTVELVPVNTTGDSNQTDALRQFGGTGVFTGEVQKAVLDERADMAVHSLKDLPTQSSEGLVLAAVPEREQRCDALLLPQSAEAITSLDDLPKGAKIGTGSPRRQAQLLRLRPDFKLFEIRGNVDTRIRKLDEGQYDAIILAEAGLRRLELAERISFLLTPPTVYPAVSQGALGIECRDSDDATRELLQQIICPMTHAEVLAERSLLRTLRAGCHAPLGAWTQVDGDQMTLTGVLLSLDGKTRIEQTASGPVTNAAQVGIQVAELLLSNGAESLLAADNSH